jgi:hypothetical protein
VSRYGWIALAVLLLLRSWLLAHPLVAVALLFAAVGVLDLVVHGKHKRG